MFCTSCGNEVKDSDRFCPECGAQLQTGAPEVPVTSSEAPSASSERRFSVPGGMLAWSICTTIFFSRIFGIIGIVFSVLAGDSTTQKEYDSKYRVARVMCTIGTVIGILIILAVILFFFFVGFTTMGMPHWRSLT